MFREAGMTIFKISRTPYYLIFDGFEFADVKFFALTGSTLFKITSKKDAVSSLGVTGNKRKSSKRQLEHRRQPQKKKTSKAAWAPKVATKKKKRQRRSGSSKVQGFVNY